MEEEEGEALRLPRFGCKLMGAVEAEEEFEEERAEALRGED